MKKVEYSPLGWTSDLDFDCQVCKSTIYSHDLEGWAECRNCGATYIVEIKIYRPVAKKTIE